MPRFRKLPQREHVFVLSLLYHGYRLAKPTTFRKKGNRYVIPSTQREDTEGIDFWIKERGRTELVSVQLTQRGTALLRKYRKTAEEHRVDVETFRNARLREKQERCKRNGVAFVLVRDFDGKRPSRAIAWGDVKALRYALEPHLALA